MNNNISSNSNLSNNKIIKPEGNHSEQWLFAVRKEYSHQYLTRSDFSQAQEQRINPIADHITINDLPNTQEDWDKILHAGTSQHKMVYIYMSEKLFHVNAIYIDVKNKKIYSLPDGLQIQLLAKGYTNYLPAIDIFAIKKETLQSDAISCASIAYQFGTKIENLLKANHELININAKDLDDEISIAEFSFKKQYQDPEDAISHYLLPENFYGITQRRAPIILNQKLVSLTNQPQLNSIPKPEHPPQYKIDFAKYFMHHKKFDKSNKYEYVFNNIKHNNIHQVYQQKIPHKEQLIAALNKIKANSDEQPKAALALAVQLTMLSGIIPNENFYQEFNLTENNFIQQLITESIKNPQHLKQLIADLQLNMNTKIVTALVTQLDVINGQELKKYIPEIVAELLINNKEQGLELTNKLLQSYQLNDDISSIKSIVKILIREKLGSTNISTFITALSQHIDQDMAYLLLQAKNKELCELALSHPDIKQHIPDFYVILHALVSGHSWLESKVANLAELTGKDSLMLMIEANLNEAQQLNTFQKQLLSKIFNLAIKELKKLTPTQRPGSHEKAIARVNKFLANSLLLLPEATAEVRYILKFADKNKIPLMAHPVTTLLLQSRSTKIDIELQYQLVSQLDQATFAQLLSTIAQKNDPELFNALLNLRQPTPNQIATVADSLYKIDAYTTLKKVSALIKQTYQALEYNDQQKIMTGIINLINVESKTNANIGYDLFTQFSHNLHENNISDLIQNALFSSSKYPVLAVQQLINSATQAQLEEWALSSRIGMAIEFSEASSNLSLKSALAPLSSKLN